jgi:hypothetical protein
MAFLDDVALVKKFDSSTYDNRVQRVLRLYRPAVADWRNEMVVVSTMELTSPTPSMKGWPARHSELIAELISILDESNSTLNGLLRDVIVFTYVTINALRGVDAGMYLNATDFSTLQTAANTYLTLT